MFAGQAEKENIFTLLLYIILKRNTFSDFLY